MGGASVLAAEMHGAAVMVEQNVIPVGPDLVIIVASIV